MNYYLQSNACGLENSTVNLIFLSFQQQKETSELKLIAIIARGKNFFL